MVDICIIGSTHRCGSTLVQRLCNAHSETMVWGESGGHVNQMSIMRDAMIEFARFSEVHEQREEYFRRGRPADWKVANLCPPEDVCDGAADAALRELLGRMYPREQWKRVGFKEVRIRPGGVELMRRNYPDCEMVLLARNPLAVWLGLDDSWGLTLESFWAEWRVNVFGYLRHPDDFFWYEDLLSVPAVTERLRGVARLTQEEFDAVTGKRVHATGKRDKDVRRSSLPRLWELAENDQELRDRLGDRVSGWRAVLDG